VKEMPADSAAAALGVSVRTIKNWGAAGRLKSRKDGGRRLFMVPEAGEEGYLEQTADPRAGLVRRDMFEATRRDLESMEQALQVAQSAHAGLVQALRNAQDHAAEQARRLEDERREAEARARQSAQTAADLQVQVAQAKAEADRLEAGQESAVLDLERVAGELREAKAQAGAAAERAGKAEEDRSAAQMAAAQALAQVEEGKRLHTAVVAAHRAQVEVEVRTARTRGWAWAFAGVLVGLALAGAILAIVVQRIPSQDEHGRERVAAERAFAENGWPSGQDALKELIKAEAAGNVQPAPGVVSRPGDIEQTTPSGNAAP
jgi:hypothetical protein